MAPRDVVRASNHKAEKRQHILDCAERAFAQRGVVAVTMDEIARTAGVSKGALYLLFSGKDEIYMQLATAAALGLAARMRQVTERRTGFERARQLLRTYAGYYVEDAARFRLALAWLAPGFHLDEAIPATNAYREVIVEIMRLAVTAFEQGQRDGSIRRDLDASRTVLQLWGGVVGLLLLRSKAIDDGPAPPQTNAALWGALASQHSGPPWTNFDPLVTEFVNLAMSAVRAPAASARRPAKGRAPT